MTHQAKERMARVTIRPVGEDGGHKGSSSWQSLARGTGSIEADYLNGEITLLGRLHGVPTPVNAMLQDVANDMARERAAARVLHRRAARGAPRTEILTTDRS